MKLKNLRLNLWPRMFRRWAPTSLFARSLLIIILPVAVMQVAVTWAFFEAHWQIVTRQLSDGLAGDIAWDVSAYEADPSPTSLARLADRAERTQSLSIALQPGKTLPTGRPRGRVLPAFDQGLRNALDDRLTEDFWVDTTRYPAFVDVRVKVRAGVLRIIAPRDRAFAERGHVPSRCVYDIQAPAISICRMPATGLAPPATGFPRPRALHTGTASLFFFCQGEGVPSPFCLRRSSNPNIEGRSPRPTGP